jgi:hypothetical protein
MTNTKLILCDGDSWTSGDMINPELKVTWVNDPTNDSYRLPKVWPHMLGKLLNTEVLNISQAGSSNDGIVRRTLDNVNHYLEQGNNPEELFVIIGWSSPERKDFYYRNPRDMYHCHWETLYPNQLEQSFEHDKDLKSFYEKYIINFWNPEEYISRYIQQILFLHYFLSSNNIKHKFFNAFYEELEGDETPLEKAKLGVVAGMFNYRDLMSDLTSHRTIHKSTIKQFSKVYNKIFITESFRNYLRRISNDDKFLDSVQNNQIEKKHFELDGHHPNNKGHQLWSKVVFENIKDML